ncbi:hypothetical protein BOVA115_1699 [Bacteroides ovatus]|nr:hypothetical protein BOVA115_1699 [Bacteroides ovatus]
MFHCILYHFLVLTTQEEQEQRFAVTYEVTGMLLLKLSV